MQLRKATRKQAKLRIGLSAPSGFGKTYSALLMAFGITGDWEKIAVIDTENGSGELYSHLGDYNALPLEAPYSPERYIQAIKACEDAGMEVIIIDSISHEWEGKGGCLEIQEKLGGKYQDWAKVTPRHQAFIEAILTSKCHIITTVRRKQDYSMVQEGNKTKVEKTGLKEVTRDGFEYELTVNLNIINDKHLAQASKDRTGLFMDKPEFIITSETGKKLREWAETGIDVAALEAAEKEKAQAEAEALGLELEDKKNELIALVEGEIDCLGEELANTMKRSIEGMDLSKYDLLKERINKRIKECPSAATTKTEEQPAVQAPTLAISAYATSRQKEEIIALSNNKLMTRQEKTQALLKMNKLTEEEAAELILGMKVTIEGRQKEAGIIPKPTTPPQGSDAATDSQRAYILDYVSKKPFSNEEAEEIKVQCSSAHLTVAEAADLISQMETLIKKREAGEEQSQAA